MLEMKRYIQYAMLFTILLMYGSPALAQSYGVQGSWTVRDTTFTNRVKPTSTSTDKIINFDSIKVRQMVVQDSNWVSKLRTPRLYAETLFTADVNYWAITHADSLNEFIVLMSRKDSDTAGAANGDTNVVGRVKTSDSIEVGFSVKSLGTWGHSNLQLRGAGRWSDAYLQWNANPMGRNYNHTNALDSIPYWEMRQFKNGTDEVLAIQRKAGGALIGQPNTTLYNRTFFRFQNDEIVADSKLRTLDTLFAMKPVYRGYSGIVTANDSLPTLGTVKKIVRDSVMKLPDSSEVRSIVRDTMSVFRTELHGQQDLHYDHGFFFRYMLNYSKMDNSDTSITWFPQTAKPFTDSSKNAPAAAAGNLWNSVAFLDSNRLVRTKDPDFLNSNFTFATFFRCTTASAAKYLVWAMDHQNISSALCGWRIMILPTYISFYVSDSTGGGGMPVSLSIVGNFADNAWHFIAASCDSNNGIARLLVDNNYVEATGITFTGHYIMNSKASIPQPMYLGYYPYTQTPLGGYIDDWCFFGGVAAGTNAGLDRWKVDMLRNWLYQTVFTTNVK